MYSVFMLHLYTLYILHTVLHSWSNTPGYNTAGISRLMPLYFVILPLFARSPATTEIEENNLGQMLMADRVQNSPYEVRPNSGVEAGS